jgi:hypothetical protein
MELIVRRAQAALLRNASKPVKSLEFFFMAARQREQTKYPLLGCESVGHWPTPSGGGDEGRTRGLTEGESTRRLPIS